jgi:hypothetical protein
MNAMSTVRLNGSLIFFPSGIRRCMAFDWRKPPSLHRPGQFGLLPGRRTNPNLGIPGLCAFFTGQGCCSGTPMRVRAFLLAPFPQLN